MCVCVCVCNFGHKKDVKIIFEGPSLIVLCGYFGPQNQLTVFGNGEQKTMRVNYIYQSFPN